MKLRRLASVMLILLPCLFVCLGGVPVSTKPRLQLFKVQQHRASGAWRVRVGKNAKLYHGIIICKGIQGVFWNEKKTPLRYFPPYFAQENLQILERQHGGTENRENIRKILKSLFDFFCCIIWHF